MIETAASTFSRRSFLAAMLSACAAPAIVRPGSLMPIIVPSREIALPAWEVKVYSEDDMARFTATDVRMSGGSYRDIVAGRCVMVNGAHAYRYPKELDVNFPVSALRVELQ